MAIDFILSLITYIYLINKILYHTSNYITYAFLHFFTQLKTSLYFSYFVAIHNHTIFNA